MNYKETQDYKDYESYKEELLEENNINSYYEIKEKEIVETDIQDEADLTEALENIKESIENKLNQESYDEDSKWFREKYDYIEDENNLKAYRDLKENYTIYEVFYNEKSNKEIERLTPSIEWFI